MNSEEIERFFAELKYQSDNRRAPDEERRARFRSGWEDATERGKAYSKSTMQRLTWQNLGYRFGRRFGTIPTNQIDITYDTLAAHWERIWGKSSEQNGSTIPSADQYRSAFQRVEKVTDTQLQMLRTHYHSPGRTLTASQMAQAAGYRHYSSANSQYGRLGRLVGTELEFNPTKDRLGTLVLFEQRAGEWHWIMRPQVAQALESLGWVEENTILTPEEISATIAGFVEGAVCRVTVNAYERNPTARRRCIDAHGTACCVCKFNFGEVYGEIAEGFTHVHHLRPLSEIGGEYEVDPVSDLRPVCPNCHAVLHRRVPSFSIEEVQAMMRRRRD